MVCSLVSLYFNSPQLGIQKKKKKKTSLNYWSRYMLNFNFSEKGLQLVSLSHFVYDFSRKIKTKTKNLKSQDETKYRENEKSFWGEIKSIFHHFKRAFSCQKLSQNWECVFLTLGWNTHLLFNTDTVNFASKTHEGELVLLIFVLWRCFIMVGGWLLVGWKNVFRAN